jgi:ribonuclease D
VNLHRDRAATEPAVEPARWIDDDVALGEALDAVKAADIYAVDTEFHRERTYYPRLALVQIAWADDVVLIDPLAVDVRGLAKVFDGPGLAVMHAAGQDLEVLAHACDAVPSTMFDTQIAAGFVGMSSPSLASLVDRYLGVRLPKGDRLTDWLARPLGAPQRDYAAADVAHLLDLHRLLVQELAARGRLEWAEAECEVARSRSRPTVEPDSAWLRIKEARHLRGTARGVARELAAWRERLARDLDQPVRFVLSDLALVNVAQRMPNGPDGLDGIRGLDRRQLKEPAQRGLLAAVAAGRDLTQGEVDAAVPTTRALPRHLRPAITLISAWVTQLARDEDLDPALLATRADIEALLREDPDARLTRGWRNQLLGEPIRQLVEGRAALAFERGHGLVLETRVSTR